MQQVQHDARAGGADRMAQRDGAALDVQALLVEYSPRRGAQMLTAIVGVVPCRQAGQYLGGKGLVDFPEVQVIQPQLMALQNRAGRVYWTQAHLRGVQAGPLRVDDAS